MIVTTFCRCGTDASIDVLADSEGELYARPSRPGDRSLCGRIPIVAELNRRGQGFADHTRESLRALAAEVDAVELAAYRHTA